MTQLYGTTVTLRPVAEDDVKRLAAILAEPEVALWWPRYDTDRVRRELIDRPDVFAYAIEVDGELVGCAQYHEEPARDFRYASIDLFIDPAWQGKGLGTDAARTLSRHLIYDKGHHRLAIDPPADNERAIRTFERAGFQRVGLMREYARDGDGMWRDGLLMELLKRDLQGP